MRLYFNNTYDHDLTNYAILNMYSNGMRYCNVCRYCGKRNVCKSLRVMKELVIAQPWNNYVMCRLWVGDII